MKKDTPANKLLGTSIDSITIGKRGYDKVELKEYNVDSPYVIIDFFIREEDSNWSKKQSFTFSQPPVDADMKIEDHNGDGFMDMSYISATAARSANELRSVFLYDAGTGHFTFLKNSQEFPNLSYNAEVGCLEAMYFYGTSCNSFLMVQGDSLREFIAASIEHGDDDKYYREVYFTDNAGKRKLLERKRIAEERVFDSYTNYGLIKKYKNR